MNYNVFQELLEKLSVNSENPNSPQSVGSKDINLHCEVCDMNGGTLMCVTCGRGFHSMCHVPLITTRLWGVGESAHSADVRWSSGSQS